MSQSAAERSGLAFRVQRRFGKPREKVFRAWTDPEVLKQWWCPKGWAPAEIEIDLRAGGSYRIGMRREGGGAPVYVRGCFVEVQAPERLSYTWQWENAFPDMPRTHVTVEFHTDGAGTVVSLTHERLPELGVCLRHRSGWIEAWARLAQIL
jgi:uncharacterized protein YndB with AHSA1/START domain